MDFKTLGFVSAFKTHYASLATIFLLYPDISEHVYMSYHLVLLASVALDLFYVP